MAAILCDTGDEQPAVFMGTLLESGDTSKVCANCIVPYFVTMLGELTGADPDAILSVVSGDFGGEVDTLSPPGPEDLIDTDAEPVPTPPTRRSGRTPAVSSGAPTVIEHDETPTSDEVPPASQVS